ncbi:hypothetical protein ES703_92168 [subsurface metagenome]
MRGQKGFLLIDVLVGLAIVGVITVAFLSGLTTTLKGVSLSQERVSVESLVKSQIEYIKTQAYVAVDDYSPDDPDNRYEIVIPPDLAAAGYSVELIDMNPPPTILSEAGGYELQKITVAVKRDGKAELVVSIYRVSD